MVAGVADPLRLLELHPDSTEHLTMTKVVERAQQMRVADKQREIEVLAEAVGSWAAHGVAKVLAKLFRR